MLKTVKKEVKLYGTWMEIMNYVNTISSKGINSIDIRKSDLEESWFCTIKLEE